MLFLILTLTSMTYSTNTDQRSVGLEFAASQIANGPRWDVIAPADADIAPPGYFIICCLFLEISHIVLPEQQ